MASGSAKLLREVDRLLAAPKRIAGRADWRDIGFPGQRRWLAPLAVDGAVTAMNIVVDSFPNEPDLTFAILLIYSRCVMRLEYSLTTRHRNHPIADREIPASVPNGWIVGPHCHRWVDNRHLARGEALPEILEFAVPLPTPVRGFENSFRWFCGEAKIACSSDEVPMLPPREKLL